MASVLICGGATGIGLATLRLFRARGDTVLLADINDEAAERAVGEDAAGIAKFLHCDLIDPEAPRAAVEAAVAFGGGQLDIVFVNAGILIAAPLSEWTLDQWERTVALNLRAPFLVAQAAASYLKDSDCASIVFTASTGAFRGVAGVPAYCATKAGLVNLTRSLAAELSPSGITVNCICPGWIDTPFNDPYWASQADQEASLSRLLDTIPLHRQGVPDDVAGTVGFLTSPAARYITGQAVTIDGGYTAV